MDYKNNRKPVVNGRFYPASARDITTALSQLFSNVEKNENIENIRAIIAPHAGYIYSGEVAAAAYAQLDDNFNYENIFILAPSHYASFNGASIYNIGNYETPLGEVPVNLKIANELISSCPYLSYYADAHTREHSLEVQLPFLQHQLKPGFTIVPIVIGTQNASQLKEISNALNPFFTKNNLFIISSDFSHYPNYNDALIADDRMSKAILSKNINNLHQAIEENRKSSFHNLATSACGIAGIQILMQLLEEQSEIEIQKIKYMNSGDTDMGDYDRVVGYLSFIAYEESEKKKRNELTEHDKSTLLHLAREAIKNKLYGVEDEITKTKSYSNILNMNYGIFVSIHNKTKLRGCMGRFESSEPLHALCQKLAISSAFNDTRFKPISKEEINDISIEISVLSQVKKIESIDEIVIGTHGILIKQGSNRGTLLPQVAVENNWNVEEFLGYCSKNKAGIGWNGWKIADIFIYTATIFSD